MLGFILGWSGISGFSFYIITAGIFVIDSLIGIVMQR
jgi:hypothetical protein